MATSIQSNCVSFIHSLVFTFQQYKTSKHHIQQRVSVLMMFPFSFLSRSFFVSPLDTLLQPSSLVFGCRCSRFDCRLIVWRNFPTEKGSPSHIDLCNTNLIRNLLRNDRRWESFDKWIEVVFLTLLFLDVCLLPNKGHNHQNVPQSVRKSDKYEQWTHVVNQERFLHFHWIQYREKKFSHQPTHPQLTAHLVVIKQFYQAFAPGCKFEHFIHRHSTHKTENVVLRCEFVQLKNHKQWIINNDESYFDLTLNWNFVERNNKLWVCVLISIKAGEKHHFKPHPQLQKENLSLQTESGGGGGDGVSGDLVHCLY